MTHNPTKENTVKEKINPQEAEDCKCGCEGHEHGHAHEHGHGRDCNCGNGSGEKTAATGGGEKPAENSTGHAGGNAGKNSNGKKADGNSADANNSAEKQFDLDTLTADQLKTLVMMQDQMMQKMSEEQKTLTAKREELSTLLSKSDRYLDQLVALKADFEAYKKRTKDAAATARLDGIAFAVERLFPFLDAIDKARSASGSSGDAKAFELIHRQLLKALFEMGVEEVDVIGKAFDHNTANAIGKRSVERELDGCVIEVCQKGFSLGGRILKYPQVLVGECPADAAADPEE